MFAGYMIVKQLRGLKHMLKVESVMKSTTYALIFLFSFCAMSSLLLGVVFLEYHFNLLTKNAVFNDSSFLE